MTKVVHVAAAVIYDAQGRIFLAKRPDDKHQGGLWEFPGGKIEPDEQPSDALKRELLEEVGIQVRAFTPLIAIPHHYPDKSVYLHVFNVTDFAGEAHGREGQEVAWVSKDALNSYDFPAANTPIVNAVLLPEKLWITPAFASLEEASETVQRVVQQRALSWVLFRQKHLSQAAYAEWFNALRACLPASVLLTGHCTPDAANILKLSAVHLSSAVLMRLTDRAEFTGRYLGASCHSLEELQQAVAVGCDYATLSPVLPTQSHPETPALEWAKVEAWLAETPLPVYLLGGMQDAHLEKARSVGAQGIAGISAWLV